MFLDEYHTWHDECVQISASQGSRFAKQVAGDFNPIHDPDNKRFCVPGDLLFALVLKYYGLSEKMHFTFRGMVGDRYPLSFLSTDAASFQITGPDEKVFLEVERSGRIHRNPMLIEQITKRYVAFSGHNFPHVLQPLMAAHGVMFNPDRPLVIYDSMSFTLDPLMDPARIEVLEMSLDHSHLEVNGKRGEATLEFCITAPIGGEDAISVGRGAKKLVVSNLREYDDCRMAEVVAEFNRRKAAG